MEADDLQVMQRVQDSQGQVHLIGTLVVEECRRPNVPSNGVDRV